MEKIVYIPHKAQKYIELVCCWPFYKIVLGIFESKCLLISNVNSRNDMIHSVYHKLSTTCKFTCIFSLIYNFYKTLDVFLIEVDFRLLTIFVDSFP